MKIKIGKVMKDTTAYGNKYWIQIEDTKNTQNTDLDILLDKTVVVVIDKIQCLEDCIQEQELL